MKLHVGYFGAALKILKFGLMTAFEGSPPFQLLHHNKSHSSSEAIDPERGQEFGECPGPSAGGTDQPEEETWRLRTWTTTEFFRF
ncbi:hypothetical protein AVEN_183693-1 [Araneus ventricosus]|uniref:Uncharacterized protein n=1 Tax=Araneus ventricosus TaxID=182803 RepID=A0A4Y2SBH5_ARAVE|nr:hypothetical protein AVEN_183693-1 [Araneus ventricosus]